MRQSFELKQQVTQLLKQELTLQLRLVLEHILALLQHLTQGQAISQNELNNLKTAMAEFSEDDHYAVAHEFVRKTRSWEAELMLRMLRFAMLHEENSFGELFYLTEAIRSKLETQNARRQQKVIQKGLRMVFKGHRGMSGEAKNLSCLLDAIPQWNPSSDNYEWILAGGWAVEILTGVERRPHHDIDALILASTPYFLDCDTVHTDDYFGVISCTPGFIRSHCIWQTNWRYQDERHDVAVLCPEFLFLSKILKRPRTQDWMDIATLVNVFSKDWDLDLMRKLIRRNSCGFTETRNLMRILRTRDPNSILFQLEQFR
jgi:hypothetical protein